MAETRLTNAQIDTEVFSTYTVEPSIYRSRFYKSGVLQVNPQISALLASGGESFSLPFWKDIAGTSGDAPEEGTDQDVNNLTSGKQTFRKQVRTKAWGSNDLVSVFAGDDAIEKAADMVAGYWAQAFDIIAAKSLTGVIAENVHADSGDLVNDISGGTGDAAYISHAAIIDTQGKLGENGVIGGADGAGFGALVMHPAVYTYMRKQNLIDVFPVSDQAVPLSVYMGIPVIVTRNAYVNSGVYDTYICKAGLLQMGMSTSGYLPTEISRNPFDGFGVDSIITRRTFAIHPVGFTHLETGVAAITPSDAELAAKECWNRVYNAENCGIVVVRHKIG